MEFENQYLSYFEYKLLGGEISEVPFNLLEYKAEKKIDEMTFNRFKKVKQYPQELKLCIFELIDIFNNEDNSGVISESVGSYSVSRQSKETIEKAKNNIINQYLSNTKVNDVFVLYRGADTSEN